VEGIDELIPEDKPFERRSYERTTILTKRRGLKGKVIIHDEKQALKEAKLKRDGLVFGLMDREKKMSGLGME